MAASDARVLAGVPLFRGLDREALAAIAGDARLVRAAAGRTFFGEGEPARVFFVLARGRAKFTQISAEGHEMILRVTGPVNRSAGSRPSRRGACIRSRRAPSSRLRRTRGTARGLPR